jgi:hypothetical protein
MRKSQIQALDRTQPLLPMRPGQVERRTHDYVRHGTATLFAALDIATGEVTGKTYARHCHQERFQTILPTAGLPRIRFHDLRHAAATLMLASGTDLKVVRRGARPLGHRHHGQCLCGDPGRAEGRGRRASRPAGAPARLVAIASPAISPRRRTRLACCILEFCRVTQVPAGRQGEGRRRRRCRACPDQEPIAWQSNWLSNPRSSPPQGPSHPTTSTTRSAWPLGM